MQLSQLLFSDCRRGIKQYINSVLVLGEGNHLPNSPLSGQDHDNAVNASGDAAVRRCAIVKGLK